MRNGVAEDMRKLADLWQFWIFSKELQNDNAQSQNYKKKLISQNKPFVKLANNFFLKIAKYKLYLLIKIEHQNLGILFESH